MKLFFVLSMLIGISFSSSGHAAPCLTVGNTGNMMAKTAIEALPEFTSLKSLSVERKSPWISNVTIKLENGSTLQYKVEQGCEDAVLRATVVANPLGFVCKKGWIDCMPGPLREGPDYCGKEYREFAIENCGGPPQIAM